MKQHFFAAMTCLTLAIFSMTNASAQSAFAAIAKLDHSSNVAENSSAAKAARNNYNSRALKNFSKKFKHIKTADWLETDGSGYVAVFTENNCRTMAAYNKWGNFLYSITRYGFNEIPANIKADVQKQFEAFTIICAEQISVDDKEIYLFHIKTDRLFQTVRVADGDMEIIETLKNYQ